MKKQKQKPKTFCPEEKKQIEGEKMMKTQTNKWNASKQRGSCKMWIKQSWKCGSTFRERENENKRITDQTGCGSIGKGSKLYWQGNSESRFTYTKQCCLNCVHIRVNIKRTKP